MAVDFEHLGPAEGELFPGLTKRDTALTANGATAMGDLTNALDLTK